MVRSKGTRVGISLFSGAGGLDLGLEGVGVRFRAWAEVDEDARKTLEANFDVDPDALFSDVSVLDPQIVLAVAGVAAGDAFVVAGGPPCQAFSTAGKRRSVHDPRGAVVENYFDIVEAVRPRFFVFENVRGLLSAAVQHRPLNQRGEDAPPISEKERLGSLFRSVILPRFRGLGYEVVAGLVDAVDYGVAQRRSRVVVVGSRDGEFRGPEFEEDAGRPVSLHDLMPPTHTAPAGLSKRKHGGAAARDEKLPDWLNLRHALSGMPDEEPVGMSYSAARAAVLKDIPPGKNWRFVRENPDLFARDFLADIMGGALEATGGKVGFWRRLSFEEPSPTLTTSPVQKATSLCHPIDVRPLSVQEYRRVQDFPDDFTLCGGTASKYRQLGNAVPVGLAKAVGWLFVRASTGKPWKKPRAARGRVQANGWYQVRAPQPAAQNGARPVNGKVSGRPGRRRSRRPAGAAQ